MRRIAAILLLALALAAAAWSAFWVYAARDIEARVAAWAEAQRAQGLTVDYTGLAVEGFPLTWRVGVAAPHLEGAGPTNWAWQGESLVATIRPWAWRDIPAAFPGVHRLAAGTGDLAEQIEARAERPQGRIVLAPDGRLESLALDLGALEFRRLPDPSFVHVARLAAVLEPHRVPAPTHGTDVFDVVARAQSVTLPAAPRHGLGPSIQQAELALTMRGALPPGRLADSVAAWRDAGGVIEVSRLALRWGPLDADGDGTLSLDAERRPLGAFSARIRGYGETLDALATAGLVRPRDAATVKIALNLFARQDAGGGRELSVPITVQDGRVTVAGFALARVPPLVFD